MIYQFREYFCGPAGARHCSFQNSVTEVRKERIRRNEGKRKLFNYAGAGVRLMAGWNCAFHLAARLPPPAPCPYPPPTLTLIRGT